MPKPRIPRPPETLSESSGKIWRETLQRYEFTPSQLRLLEQALLSLDRAEAARLAVADAGMVAMNRHGELRPHPLIGVERDGRAAFAAIWKKLDLHLPEEN